MFLGSAGTSFAHDGELTDPRAKEAVTASVRLLQEAASKGSLTREVLIGLEEAAHPLSTRDLHHVAESKDLGHLGSGGKGLVQQAIRALKLLRATRTNVSDAPSFSLLLSSESPPDVAAAMALLSAEPYGEGYRQTVILLSRDRRPEVRLAAGILAKYAILIGGPDSGLAGVAKNLLVDDDPRVAAQFARWHCMDFDNVDLVDRMVARLDDDRATPDMVGGLDSRFLASGEKTVAKSIKAGLRSGVSRRTQFSAKDSAPPGGESATIDQYRQWWDKLKPTWPPGPSENGWSKAFDGVVHLKPGETTRLEGCSRDLDLRLAEFRTQPDEWVPAISMSLELHDKKRYGGLGLLVGTPKQQFGWIAGAGNDTYLVRALVCPEEEGKARARLWIWAKAD